ncbi:hypothetical protein [Halobellus salinisoli]|uniref:hypothetical protein n=1 Tax=Halobellus salinisoli TaxID=3108500 RepID=UPI003008CFC4
MNPAEKFVHSMADKSPVHQYLAEHGQVVGSATECVTIAGYEITLSERITQDEKSLISDAVRATQLSEKECFTNALRLWQYDQRFKYAEGFAAFSDITDIAFEHAWCILDGEKIVDVTSEFDHHFGTIICSDSILEQYTGANMSPNGIIGNRSDQYKFLRERGYVQ